MDFMSLEGWFRSGHGMESYVCISLPSATAFAVDTFQNHACREFRGKIFSGSSFDDTFLAEEDR